MPKKVFIRDLKPRMYVCSLDRPWSETPFLFQGFEITGEAELSQLRQYCRYVYIAVDSDPHSAPRVRARDAPARPSAVVDKKAGHTPLLALVEDTPTPARSRRVYQDYQDQTTLDEEVEAIKQTHVQATALVYEMLEDARLSRSFNTAGAKQVVAAMAESVLRNPDALVCFTHLKRKDEYTAQHCLRVCILGLAFGRHLGYDTDTLNALGIGCLMHDLGKMKVPLAILNKPGRLTEQEREIMKRHVPLGVAMLEDAKGFSPAAIEVARSHHERYGGAGYINHLKGGEIGEFGLIGAIVDTYDAITSDRVYHAGIATLTALGQMYEWRERDFEPMLMEQFIQCMGVFPIGSVVRLNTGEIGVIRTRNRTRHLKPQVLVVLAPDHTPYATPKTIDLMYDTTSDARPYTIKEVLASGAHGINPMDYLPVAEGSDP
ncbi:MAG: HD-GYP domain-containing protein [Proteobacteria bacterium]|nr:MAG: HD-GYP domain-containing protein [Pseudomonadota bacterium]